MFKGNEVNCFKYGLISDLSFHNVETTLDTKDCFYRLWMSKLYSGYLLGEMAVIWSARVPTCLSANHWFEGILSPATSVYLIDPEQHRKGVKSICSPLDKRLYEAFNDMAREIRLHGHGSDVRCLSVSFSFRCPFQVFCRKLECCANVSSKEKILNLSMGTLLSNLCSFIRKSFHIKLSTIDRD